jgi:hypothetical protein
MAPPLVPLRFPSGVAIVYDERRGVKIGDGMPA